MLADRHYMREESSWDSNSWRRSPTTVLLIINLVMFILQNVDAVYLRSGFVGWLVLDPVDVAHGQIWRLFTFQFLHSGFSHFLFNSLALYMFGRPVEATLGNGRFWEVYFLSGTLGGLLQTVLGMIVPSVFGLPVVGASAGVAGLFAMFCLLHSEATIMVMFIFPMRAITLLRFSLAVSAFFVLVPTDPGIAHAAHLGGMLAAMGYTHWILRRERRLFDWRPYAETARQRERELVTAKASRASWQREKPKVEEELPPGEFISKEVDPILDKISQHGIHSLTDRERKVLEKARAKMSKR